MSLYFARNIHPLYLQLKRCYCYGSIFSSPPSTSSSSCTLWNRRLYDYNNMHYRSFVWHAGYENIKDSEEIKKEINRLFNLKHTIEHQQRLESRNNNLDATANDEVNIINIQIEDLVQNYERITGEKYEHND